MKADEIYGMDRRDGEEGLDTQCPGEVVIAASGVRFRVERSGGLMEVVGMDYMGADTTSDNSPFPCHRAAPRCLDPKNLSPTITARALKKAT